jgi:hexosaminidase
MAYSKFNVFHWHIVDDQSYPLQSLRYPKLTENGRYTKDHVYTQNDVKNIIKHARLRGIRVIPEFDSPGHVAAFGRTFPELITVCWNNGKPYQGIYSVQAKAEIFNPTIEELYPIVENVLNEFKDLFPDEYVHLGNDEVYYECWKSNPNITQWMLENGFTKYNQLEAYYSAKLLGIAKKLNKKVTVWQDVYDNHVELEKTTQIQIWKDTSTLSYHATWQEYLSNITRDGYRAILSSPWYLNFISYGYQDWYRYYTIEPMSNFTGNKDLLIGGEACLWAGND